MSNKNRRKYRLVIDFINQLLVDQDVFWKYLFENEKSILYFFQTFILSNIPLHAICCIECLERKSIEAGLPMYQAESTKRENYLGYYATDIISYLQKGVNDMGTEEEVFLVVFEFWVAESTWFLDGILPMEYRFCLNPNWIMPMIYGFQVKIIEMEVPDKN